MGSTPARRTSSLPGLVIVLVVVLVLENPPVGAIHGRFFGVKEVSRGDAETQSGGEKNGRKSRCNLLIINKIRQNSPFLSKKLPKRPKNGQKQDKNAKKRRKTASFPVSESPDRTPADINPSRNNSPVPLFFCDRFLVVDFKGLMVVRQTLQIDVSRSSRT